MKLSDTKKFERACKIRKAWKSKKYKTHGDIAAKFGVSIHHAKAVIQNRVCIEQEAPEGVYKSIELQGRKFHIYDDGRVWSVKTHRFIESYLNNYKIICVRDLTSRKMLNYRVHRLMLELFVRPPKKGEFGRHLDDNPRNLKLSNLAWGTPKENSSDMAANNHQALGELNGRAALTEVQVRKFYESYDGKTPHKPFVRSYMKKNRLDVEPLQLLRILRGKAWTHITGITNYQKQFEVKLNSDLVERIFKGFLKTNKTRYDYAESVSHKLKTNYALSFDRKYILSILDGKKWKAVYAKYKDQLPDNIPSNKKLTDSAVHACHKYWLKSELNQAEFCRCFSAYLKLKNIEVAPKTLKKVLNGDTWQEIYAVYN